MILTKNKFRKYNKFFKNKKTFKKHYKKTKKYKKIRGGTNGPQDTTRKSGRIRGKPKTLLDESSKQFEKEMEKREKEKKELLKQQKEEKEKQREKQKELDKELDKTHDSIAVNDMQSQKKNYDFKDILVWKSLSEIKKIIQNDLFGITPHSNKNKIFFNKYGVLHKDVFKDMFEGKLQKLSTFLELKNLNDKLDNILHTYIKSNHNITKYSGITSYLINSFDEFKQYVFPQSKILKDYYLFSHLVTFYYNAEFDSKINKSGVKFNKKAKERLNALKNVLDKQQFVVEYSGYHELLKKYQKLNTYLLNSDLDDVPTYIGYELTDKDITDALSLYEIAEIIENDNSKLQEILESARRYDSSDKQKSRSRSRSKSRSSSRD